MPNCPHDSIRYEERDCVDTHGLEFGPYERWTERRWTCNDCGEWWDSEKDLEREMAAVEKELATQ